MGPFFFFSFSFLHFFVGGLRKAISEKTSSLHPLLRDGVMCLSGSSFEDQPQGRRNVHTVSLQIALLLY
jgi:hypothetical protein